MVLVLFALVSYKVDVCCEHSNLSVRGFTFTEFGVVVNNNFDNTTFLNWNFKRFVCFRGRLGIFCLLSEAVLSRELILLSSAPSVL